jgi:hypothetical protein
LIERDRALSDPLGAGGALDQFHDEGTVFDAMDGGDVGMVERGEDLASRVNRARRSGSFANTSGRIMATSRLSLAAGHGRK